MLHSSLLIGPMPDQSPLIGSKQHVTSFCKPNQCRPFLHSLFPLCCWGTLRHFFLQHFLQSEEKKHTLDVYKVEQFHKWTNYNVQITNVQLITFYCPIMEQKHVKKIVKPIRLQGREIPQRSKHCTKGLTPPLKKRKKCIYLFL